MLVDCRFWSIAYVRNQNFGTKTLDALADELMSWPDNACLRTFGRLQCLFYRLSEIFAWCTRLG